MTTHSVTFETKCYEKDWEILLKTDRLEAMIARNRCDFTDRVLYINNVADPDMVRSHAERLKQRGVITEHVLVDECADQALTFFGLDRDSFQGGYYYSIQELVGIYRCRTDYLLHFSGDSILDGTFEWIDAAIRKMEADQRVKVATCLWNNNREDADNDSVEQDQDYWLDFGFSDQCYLLKTVDFRTPIYNQTHPASQRFPVYGGELFEKRVDAWMRNNGYLRCVNKHGSYLHKNYSRHRLVRSAKRILGLYDH